MYTPKIETAINEKGETVIYINGHKAELESWIEKCDYSGTITYEIEFTTAVQPLKDDNQTIQIFPAKEGQAENEGLHKAASALPAIRRGR